MTDKELIAEVTHTLRSSLAVIAGYSEIGLTRDDPGLRAEARTAVTGAIADLTDGLDEVLLALELAWEPRTVETAEIDLRAAAAQASARAGARREVAVEPGEEVWALADGEVVVRALQALLRAAGPGASTLTLADDDTRAIATIRAEGDVPPDEVVLSLRNARRLAELLQGSVTVDGAVLELELPKP